MNSSPLSAYFSRQDSVYLPSLNPSPAALSSPLDAPNSSASNSQQYQLQQSPKSVIQRKPTNYPNAQSPMVSSSSYLPTPVTTPSHEYFPLPDPPPLPPTTFGSSPLSSNSYYTSSKPRPPSPTDSLSRLISWADERGEPLEVSYDYDDYLSRIWDLVMKHQPMPQQLHQQQQQQQQQQQYDIMQLQQTQKLNKRELTTKNSLVGDYPFEGTLPSPSANAVSPSLSYENNGPTTKSSTTSSISSPIFISSPNFDLKNIKKFSKKIKDDLLKVDNSDFIF